MTWLVQSSGNRKSHSNLISVVITTYGGDHWREIARQRAIPSTEDQGAYEIIVHHEPRMRIGPARNAAARRATGEWLLFLDADDELEPEYVHAMTDAICSEKRPEPALLQPAVRYVHNKRSLPPFMAPEEDLRHSNYLVVGTVLRRKLFIQVGGFDDFPHGFEDWSLWVKCWKEGARVFQVPNAIYRAHINQQSEHHKIWRNRRLQGELHRAIEAQLFPEN